MVNLITRVWYQPGMVGCQSCSSSAGQGRFIFSCPGSRLRIWSRETGSAVPSRVSLFISILSRNSSRVPRRRPFFFFKPAYATGSVPILSSHAIAYRWHSLPRVRRHRASKPQASSSQRVLPWQVTMDQFICASLSHTHYWYMKWAC